MVHFCDTTALHLVIPPVVLCRPGASVLLAEPADRLLLGRGIAILYLGCHMLLRVVIGCYRLLYVVITNLGDNWTLPCYT